MGGLSQSVKKGKFVTKIFFQILLNEVLKVLEKWYADIKTNKNNNKKKKIWWLYLTNFYKKVASKLELQHKKGMHFSFNFGWYSIDFAIVR